MSFPTYFTPFANTITNITNSNPGVVTTATDHGYDDNLSVRIVFPFGSDFGMNQVSGQVYQITVISPASFSIGVDTTTFGTFALGSNKQVPQVIPVAEINYTFSEATINSGNIIPET